MKIFISILGIIATNIIKKFFIWNNSPFFCIVLATILNGSFGFIFLNNLLEHFINNKKLLILFRSFLVSFVVLTIVISCIQLKE